MARSHLSVLTLQGLLVKDNIGYIEPNKISELVSKMKLLENENNEEWTLFIGYERWSVSTDYVQLKEYKKDLHGNFNQLGLSFF